MLVVFALVLVVLVSVVLVGDGAGDVGIGLFVPVGVGQCWLLAVVLVVAFVLVHTGVRIAPFFLLIDVLVVVCPFVAGLIRVGTGVGPFVEDAT